MMKNRYGMPAALAIALAPLMSAPLGGCGGSQPGAAVETSPTQVAPAAEASIDVRPRTGANAVDLSVAHLPPPERLGSGLSHYAVWFRAPYQRGAVFAGLLNFDRESRVGALHATTPYDDFQVLVTAEAGMTPRAPQGPVVVQGSVRAN